MTRTYRQWMVRHLKTHRRSAQQHRAYTLCKIFSMGLIDSCRWHMICPVELAHEVSAGRQGAPIDPWSPTPRIPTPVYTTTWTGPRVQHWGQEWAGWPTLSGRVFNLVVPHRPAYLWRGCAVVVRDRPVGVLPAGATSSIPGSHAGTSVRIESRLRNLLRPLVDFSILHDEVHFLKLSDVGHRVARHCHNVSELARLERANFVLHAQQLGSRHGGRAQRLRRSHAVLHLQRKFLCRIHGPGKSACVGAEGNLYSGVQGAPEGRTMNAHHVNPHLRSFCSAPLSHVLANKERRHVVNALSDHRLQVRIGDVEAVLDGVHAGLNRIVHSIQRGGMGGNLVALAMRLVHDGAQLVHGEGRDVVEDAIGLYAVTAVGINLNPIHSVGDLLAYCFAPAVGAVHLLYALGPLQLPRIFEDGVRAGHVHRTSRDLHAWPRNNARVDGLLDVHIRVAGALGFKVANGGEPVAQGALRGDRAENGAVRRGLLQDLHVIVCGRDVALQQHVRMGVDQAGEADLAAEVDDFRASFLGDAVAELVDLPANDADPNVLARAVALAVIKRPAMQVDHFRRDR